MMRGQIKKKVLEQLDNGGPMTVRQLSDTLKLEKWDIEGAVRSLFLDGSIYMFKKDRRNSCTWASK